MAKLRKNPIIQLIEQKNTQAKVANAQNRFRFKPFFEKYAGLNTTARVLQVLLPLISISTGIVFLRLVLQNIVPHVYLAYIFAAALIGLLEFSKSYLLNIAFTDFYAGLRGYVELLIASALIFASAYTSLNGIKEIHQHFDKSLLNLSEIQATQKDSLVKYFDNQIQSVKNDLTAFRAAVSWQGKINMFNEANATTIKNYSNQITLLQSEKSKALGQLTALHQAQTQTTANAAGFNLWVVICVIALIELCILIANWFIIFYDYQTAKQAETLKAGQNDLLISGDTFAQMVGNFLTTTGLGEPIPQHLGQKSFTIGFQRNNNTINTDEQKATKTPQKPSIDTSIDIPINTESESTIDTKINLKDRLFLEAYANVVDDLQAGKSYGQILKKEYIVTDLRTNTQVKKRISKTTLQNINRVLNNL